MTIQNINKLLVQHDIEGLIEAGAPIDEYTDEAAQIAAALALLNREELTEEVVLSIVSLIWLKSFELEEQDMELRLPALRQVSQAICLK